MTIEQVEMLIELHRRIAELARRSPTFRVLAPWVVTLLARIERTRPQ